MYGYIYKTTNLVNGKIYIGQKKSKTFLHNEYLGSGKYLKCAIAHYGKENFVVEMLDYSMSKDGLDELEKLYINKFNSTNHNIGYNIAVGAVGGDTYTNLSEEDKKLRNENYSRSRKSNTNKYILIHKDCINKRIDITVWPQYEQDGWKRGRSADLEKKLSESHKGVKQSTEWIQKRVNSGWKNKSPEEYAKMIEKHRISAKRQMANTSKEERVRRAKNANKFTGKECCFVTNGEEVHFIIKSELQSYLNKGYVLGMKIKENK